MSSSGNMADTRAWIRPVIVLVPDAWNTPGSFNLLVPLLHKAGYSTRSVSLPSVGAEPPTDSIRPDVEEIRAVVREEVEASKEVLLMMQGYASIPGGEAVKDLDRATRLRSGLGGGVVCLFFSASPVLPLGSCLADLFRDGDHSWMVASRDLKVAVLDRPVDILCPEVEPELAREYTASLRPHSYQTFFGKTTHEPYRNIPVFCLFSRLDKVISVSAQKKLIAATGVKYKSSTMLSGHCPFLTEPEGMAKAIRRAAKESAYQSDVIVRDYAK